jgi:hypothetical protein
MRRGLAVVFVVASIYLYLTRTDDGRVLMTRTDDGRVLMTRTDDGRVLTSQNEPPEVDESFVQSRERVSITPWKLVVEGGQLNRTTIEVTVRDGRSNRTVSAPASSARVLPTLRRLL